MKAAERQIQRDHAQKQLMDNENEKLRQRLFWKQEKKKDKRATTEARHLTSEEQKYERFKKLFSDMILEDAKEVLKARRQAIDDYYKNRVLEEQRQAQDTRKRVADAKKAKAEAEKREGQWRREMSLLAKYVDEFETAEIKRQAKRKTTQKPRRKAVAPPVVEDEEGEEGDETFEEPPPKPRPRPRPADTSNHTAQSPQAGPSTAPEPTVTPRYALRNRQR